MLQTGLAEVENWIHGAGKEWVGESWDELRYIRQVRLVNSAAVPAAEICLQAPSSALASPAEMCNRKC